MIRFERALRVLEYKKVLAEVAELAPTEGARSRILSMTPSASFRTVTDMLSQTDDAKYLIGLKGSPQFGTVHDIGSALERAKKSAKLSLRELLDIAEVLKSASSLKEYIVSDRKKQTVLDDVFERLYTNDKLSEKIFRSIVSEELVADEASPALADIRRKIRRANDKVRDSLHNYVTSANYSKFLQDGIVTTRGGRFVIPVKSEYRNEIKGLVHDTSATGATLFVEPLTVVETNNEIRLLAIDEEKEIERIIYALSSECADFALQLAEDYNTITFIACVFARAEYSYRTDSTSPVISKENRVSFINARHPLLDKDKVVPISIALGGEYSQLVITGPNTGGKTVSLKTLGLLSLMAQSGLHIPADTGSEFVIFSDILADIGDEQSIEQNLSTFSAHMVNVISILQQADETSLVLLDELGSGTDPVEGAALANAILEDLKIKGAFCAVTSHYAEIKAYALNTNGVQNASCEFDVETLKPTYRLIIGTPGKSNAFAISQRLGLPDYIVNKAKSFISSDSLHFEDVLQKLEATRMEMERKRDEAENASQKARAEYEEAVKEAKRKAELADKEYEKARAEAARIVRSARATSEYVLAELDELRRAKEKEEFAQNLDKARRAIGKSLDKLDDEANPVRRADMSDYEPVESVKAGDTVFIPDMKQNATVNKAPDKDGNVELQIGVIRTKLHISKLAKPDKAALKKKKKVQSAGYIPSTKEFEMELDMRGQTGDDAWFMTDRYMDDALRAGVHTVTLLHGKGTGALRSHLWQCLKRDKRVKSFRAGAYGEGDYGVTVVELK